MSNFLIDHPTEDALIEHVLAVGEKEDTVEKHVDECASCSETLAQFRGLKEALISMPEEELPDSLRKRILKSSDGVQKQFEILSAIQLVRSPFVAGIGIVILVLFLYFLYFFIS